MTVGKSGQHTMIRSKRCECRIEKVLTQQEADAMRCLYKLVPSKNAPRKDRLALIKADDMGVCPTCEYLFVWGYNYYCNCQEVIERYEEEQAHAGTGSEAEQRNSSLDDHGSDQGQVLK